MGSSGSSAGSLRRSNQSSRTGLPGAGLGGAGCCADAVSGKAAAAPARKAMNSRLFIVASHFHCEVFVWFLGDGQRNGRFVREAPGMHHLRLAVKATPIVDARKGRDDE